MNSSSSTHQPAASAPIVPPTDPHLNKNVSIIDKLVQEYGVEPELARKTVNSVENPTLLACYRHILDNTASVGPSKDCPHLASHSVIAIKDVSLDSLACSHFENTSNGGNEQEGAGVCPSEDNLFCVACGSCRCSRFANAHSISHWQDTKQSADKNGHCLGVNLKDFTVWCHQCRSVVNTQASLPLEALVSHLRENLHSTGTDNEEPDKKRQRSERDQEDSLSASSRDNNNDGSGNESDDENSDGPTIDLDNMDDDTLLQFLTTIANSQGIPLELLMQSVQQQSSLRDDPNLDYPFGTAPSNLQDVADFIQSDKCQKIVILAGAGMSVSSGIPDYRSPNGFYANLRTDLITASPVQQEAIRSDPSVALDQDLFLQNPLPCLELKRDFILGTFRHRWKATLAHRFVELLYRKTGKVARLYTQNIDGLEDQCTDLPQEKIIAVHGSMDKAECASCGAVSDYRQFCQAVESQIKDLTLQDPKAPAESTPIVCRACGKETVKPAIVLFRSSLPRIFFESLPADVEDVDLLIIMGTSLRVAPANSLVWRVPKTCLRVLMNNETAGEHLGINFGEDRVRDYYAAGDCDDAALELIDRLGWLSEIAPLATTGDLPAKCADKLRERLAQQDKKKAVSV